MILGRRTVVAAKVESEEGTAETLTAAEAFRVSNVGFTPRVEMNKREIVRDSLSKVADLPGIRSAEMSFDVELVGNTTGGTAPEWSDLMKAVGFTETLGSGIVTYALSSDPDDFKSLTIGAYTDGVLSRIWGARGTVQTVLQAGKPGILRFTFTGADFDVSDTAILSPTFDTSVPEAFKSATFTMGSDQLQIGSLTLSLNNQIQLRSDITKSSGHLSAMITGRESSGEFDPEMELVATHDFYGKWKDGNLSALSATWGSTASKVSVSAPKCQYSAIRWTDRGALRALGVTFGMVEDSGSDELEIVLGTTT